MADTVSAQMADAANDLIERTEGIPVNDLAARLVEAGFAVELTTAGAYGLVIEQSRIVATFAVEDGGVYDWTFNHGTPGTWLRAVEAAIGW